MLEGGYKLFYENYLDYCEPKTYKPMLHEEHQYDYKHFRAKAKSWEVSRHHIVYKYNEHLQRQKSLKEEKDETAETMETMDSTESTNPISSTQRRVIKMKL